MAEIAWRVLVQSNLALWAIKIAYIRVFFVQSSEQLVRLNLMAFTSKKYLEITFFYRQFFRKIFDF